MERATQSTPRGGFLAGCADVGHEVQLTLPICTSDDNGFLNGRDSEQGRFHFGHFMISIQSDQGVTVNPLLVPMEV